MGPIPLTSSSRGCLGIAFTKTLVFPLKLWNAEDGVVPQPFPLTPRPSIIRPRQKTPSARALGPDRVWAELPTSRTHNSPSKSCYPSPRMDRRVLLTSEICQCLSILVTYRFPRFFIRPRHVPRALGRRNVSSLNTGGFMLPTFYGMMEIKRW